MLCFGKGGSHQLSGRMLYLDYSQFLFNRAPNDHIGSSTTPWTMLTGFGFCLYFNEVFSLRHHDQRRALLKRDAEQPDIMDDFADPNSDAVLSLYLDPDSSLPPHPLDDDLPRRAVSNRPAAANAALDSTESEHQRKRPLAPTAIAAEHVRNLLREGVVLRPFRLLPVGDSARRYLSTCMPPLWRKHLLSVQQKQTLIGILKGDSFRFLAMSRTFRVMCTVRLSCHNAGRIIFQVYRSDFSG